MPLFILYQFPLDLEITFLKNLRITDVFAKNGHLTLVDKTFSDTLNWLPKILKIAVP